MKIRAARQPADLAAAPEYGRMVKVLFWVAFGVTLGLGHNWVQVATRDMAIQRGRFQVEREELWNKRCALASEVTRLSGGDDVMECARAMGLIEVPVEQIRFWPMPREIADKYDRTYSDIALARGRETDRSQREDLVEWLLGTVLSPDAQAHPASP